MRHVYESRTTISTTRLRTNDVRRAMDDSIFLFMCFFLFLFIFLCHADVCSLFSAFNHTPDFGLSVTVGTESVSFSSVRSHGTNR